MLPGALVSIRPVNDSEPIGSPLRVGSNGEFRITSLPLGKYIVSGSWVGIGRPFSKVVEVRSAQPVTINIILHFRPCADQPNDTKAAPLTPSDELAIVTDLISTFYQGQTVKKGVVRDLTIDNFHVKWLTSKQKELIRAAAPREGRKYSRKPHTILKPFQRGDCVGLDVLNGTDGASSYEYRLVNGKWSGIELSSMIY
ncbi:MAG: carboxypeptidase regulatory-like domain-containing protein [Acidobacteria bacterium]|nr:carboxypeptidase regulatory-like domain-containing protein [Acidobacteriota bacterium]